MEKGHLLYEGKAKKLYKTNENHVLLVDYKNDLTAFNGVKKSEKAGKGKLNNEISALIFERLQENGVPNHFIKKISETEQLVKQTSIIPIEVVVRNVTAGSLAKRLGLEEGIQLSEPIVEYYYKDDSLGDPLINDDHIKLLNLASDKELKNIRNQTLKVNEVLKEIFLACQLRLVDFKLEFGFDQDKNIILSDEVSPDTCRLWDLYSNEKLDKDVFRKDLGDVLKTYEEVFNRLTGLNI
ncbi:phosphoribosylaminoimidazolesuccinocarboxamide synthase [Bacillaceae bacterium W0354]